MKKSFNFSFINLGCNKNLVDTQHLLGKIFDLGANNPNYDINYITDPYNKSVDYVFLNTCGFIKAGRDEMFETIQTLVKTRHGASQKKIYLLGCALQYFKTIAKEPIKFCLPLQKEGAPLGKGFLYELSRNDFNNITINQLIKGYNSTNFSIPSSKLYSDSILSSIRAYTNAAYGFEYLKISEGCDNKCTFCIIPQIRGKQKSLPIPKILAEIKNMINAGISEIILIAQDTTQYGKDLYGHASLFKLLTEIEKIKGDFKYRLLYLYPDTITIKELKKFKKFKKFIPYFDIPLQHISSNILKRMGRLPNNCKNTTPSISLLQNIKKIFPNSFIRTNFIIGFPGETDSDQKQLINLINQDYFNNIALFEYHDEPFAASSKLDKKIPDSIIRKRFTQIRHLVNKKLMEHKKSRKGPRSGQGEKFEGYIMEIYGNPSVNRSTLTVRPILNSPEIDPYDEIKSSQIIKGNLGLGQKITYKL